MTAILLVKLLHILGFVYWLGGDLGTFFSSRFVVDPKLSPAQRAIALKIMLGCDQGPKLAMPLMFALGFQLAVQMHFIFTATWIVVSVWVMAACWFASVNYLYFTKDAAGKARVAMIDLQFRYTVVAAVLFYALFVSPGWLAAKMVIFAVLVGCGIFIRLNLKPFVEAFGTLMSKGSSPEVETAMSSSLARVRPAVYLIWAGLILEAAIGLHLINF